MDYTNGHKLQWTLDPVFNDSQDWIFTLEVAETQDFQTIIYSKVVGNTFFAIDDFSTKEQAFTNSYIYRIRLDTPISIYYSQVVNHNTSPITRRQYLQAADVTRREFLRAVFVARTGWLIKRKGFGQIDQNEVDPVSGVVMTDSKGDFAVGLTGGYYDPISFIYSKEGEDMTEGLDPQGFGNKQTLMVKLRAVGFPFVQVKDIIVSPEDLRYLITKVDVKTFPGTNVIILQNITAGLIANTDTIYSIVTPK